MPFTNGDFPGQIFSTMQEFEEAQTKRASIEAVIEERSKIEDVEITKVTATVLPASRDLMERKVSDLDSKVDELMDMIQNMGSQEPTKNKEGLLPGTILRGESKGQKHTIEALPGEEGYVCSDGEIYQSLSGAALGVSGNRRSGWKFWRNIEGTPIGEVTGRFTKDDGGNPFDTHEVQSV
jgi:hypothetical protein